MKKLLFAMMLSVFTIASNATEFPKDSITVSCELTFCLQIPNPIDKNMSPVSMNKEQITEFLLKIDAGTHSVSNIHRIPLRFYDSLILYAKDDPVDGDFTNALLSVWGIGDTSILKNKELSVPLLIKNICQILTEVKNELLCKGE